MRSLQASHLQKHWMQQAGLRKYLFNALHDVGLDMQNCAAQAWHIHSSVMIGIKKQVQNWVIDIIPACSTSRTSFASEDWVSLGTSPDFGAMYKQTRSYESAPSRGMVSGLHSSGDAPVPDHRPPAPTRSAATRVLQRPRPCS